MYGVETWLQRLHRLERVTVYTELFAYRELFGNLFRRDLQAKYKGSALGVVWVLLPPLVKSSFAHQLAGIFPLVLASLNELIKVAATPTRREHELDPSRRHDALAQHHAVEVTIDRFVRIGAMAAGTRDGWHTARGNRE